MKISALNVNFGKRLVATCDIKDRCRDTHSASIYEYSPTDLNDIAEISKLPDNNPIKYPFLKEGMRARNLPISRYFAVCEKRTGEMVSCAKTTRLYSTKGKHVGYSTFIDELEGNKDYPDSLTPMIGFVSYEAKRFYSDYMLSAFRTYELPELKQFGFKETNGEIWAMKKRGFESNIQKAERRNNLKIISDFDIK